MVCLNGFIFWVGLILSEFDIIVYIINNFIFIFCILYSLSWCCIISRFIIRFQEGCCISLTLPHGLYHPLSFLVDYFLPCFVMYYSEHMFSHGLLSFAIFLKILWQLRWLVLFFKKWFSILLFQESLGYFSAWRFKQKQKPKLKWYAGPKNEIFRGIFLFLLLIKFLVFTMCWWCILLA